MAKKKKKCAGPRRKGRLAVHHMTLHRLENKKEILIHSPLVFPWEESGITL